MGGLDCVNKMTESTEVFTINAASTMDLNRPRKDVESQNGNISQRTRRRILAVAIDLPLFVCLVAVIGLFEFGIIRSHKAGFYCNDPALSFPYQGEVVTTPIIVSTIILMPVAVFMLTEILISDDHSRYLQGSKLAGWFYRTYLYGLLMNLCIVEVMKGIAGSPRPSFFDLCQPDTARTCNGSEFVSTFECTSTVHSWWNQMDSYRSFPSGHTSLSVYCGFFIAWYLQKRAFDWAKLSILAVPLLQLLSISYAAICSLTRITDRRHHWWDVLAGAGVGFLTLFYAVIFLGNYFEVRKREPSVVKMEERQHSVRTLLDEDQRR